MEQNKYRGRQELPSEITGRIDRILEEMRIEEISVLEFPEQLLAVLLIEIDGKSIANRWKENPFVYEKRYTEMERKLSRIRQKIHENSGFSKVLDGFSLIPSRQALMNIWELGKRLCAMYSGLELEFDLTYGIKREFRSQILAGVMDYLADAIHHRGNKEFFFTPYNLAAFVTELVAPRFGTVWDPAFGSGTLLIQAAKRVEENYGTCWITGNEINRRMVQFARINAFYHGMSLKLVELKETDTIEEFKKDGGMAKYEYILANPPVSSV